MDFMKKNYLIALAAVVLIAAVILIYSPPKPASGAFTAVSGKSFDPLPAVNFFKTTGLNLQASEILTPKQMQEMQNKIENAGLNFNDYVSAEYPSLNVVEIDCGKMGNDFAQAGGGVFMPPGATGRCVTAAGVNTSTCPATICYPDPTSECGDPCECRFRGGHLEKPD